MGHREDLLEGAKKCLLEKGFARTTARDIVSASGANLASIGYHYGSKDALLIQAFIGIAEDWGAAVTPEVTGEGGTLDRFTSVWEGILGRHEQFTAMWAASTEIALAPDRMPELAAMLAASEGEGRRGLIALFTGIPEEELDEDDMRTLGAVYQALLTGVMVQWRFNPATAATAADLTEGIRRLAGGLSGGRTPKP
ncbi:TetR/AcrR family transcriptional regulator [Streptomyces sp. NPDC051555]|uniref:TetR/AcrR family transcriptional regulator n=1 Tax=Streptomyces sp. NPDC051555 TaxID=3365657 RepID=UPI00378ECF78